MALHETPARSDEWYTPQYIFDAMGSPRFDMDVASPKFKPAYINTRNWFWENSLEQEWHGFVWMNPPFGGRNGIVPWLQKFFEHGNGVALVPDRTSAPWWQEFVPQADLVLFVSPKIKFIPGPGAKASSPAQGTCLLAVGEQGQQALQNAKDRLGKLFCPC